MKTSENCRWCLHMSEIINYKISPVIIHVYGHRQSFNPGKKTANTITKKKNHRVTWKCVRGSKSSFTVCRDLDVILRCSMLHLLGKGLEDGISCQGPRIVVKH